MADQAGQPFGCKITVSVSRSQCGKVMSFTFPPVIISHRHCSVTWWWIFIMKWQVTTELRLPKCREGMSGCFIKSWLISRNCIRGTSRYSTGKRVECLIISHHVHKKHISRVKNFKSKFPTNEKKKTYSKKLHVIHYNSLESFVYGKGQRQWRFDLSTFMPRRVYT